MQTRSSSRPTRDQTSNPTSSTNTTPKVRNRRSSKQRVESSNLEEHLPPIVTMADNHTMAELLRGNLLERSTQDVLTIIENKSKVRNSQNKPIVSQVKACDTNSNSEIAKLTHAVNQQTSACLAASGNTFPEFKDNLQGYVLIAAVNYNQGNPSYRPQATTQQNQNFHLNELEKIKRMNEVNMKAMQTQIDMGKNKLRNEMKTSIPTSLSNQPNEINNMMASLLQIITASGSGSLPSNTIPNPKSKLKAITTRSGLVTDGPTIPTLPKSITPEVDERVEETYMDPDLTEYTIKQLHINITLADALVLMPKYQKMLKALLFNKRKLQELANTPLNENCSAVILKKLPKKLGDPGKFLILCGFSELKCKALADLGARINLMPLYVWKELGLPELIPTGITLELANRSICTPAGITRDVFVLVGKFTFQADFVIVDYESDPIVPLILGRPFLRTTRALIDVHGEEMILRDGIDSILKDSIDKQDLANLDDNFVDPIHEMFTDEHTPDYSSPPIFDEYEDDLLEVESESANVNDDPFDSKEEKIKEFKLLIDELDLPCDFLPYSEYDSFNS
nr:reverse transcriptase domain-containing protein [Tanacetum cinerariifolium]